MMRGWSSLSAAILPPSPPARGKSTLSGRGRAAAGRPELLQKALALQARYAPDGVTISNSLQTNGTLINDAWCRLFREHGFIIGLSLEGNEALQDYHRPDKRGRSTWSAAAAALTCSISIKWTLICWWWCA